ncbi:MAG: MFS transporter [Elusimicrobiaceae bacterium]|nr:MFS transporter [Elusimicrobiaceae bacterium]
MQSPWGFIPTLYLAEGFPYIVINTVSVLLYADLGLPNDQIAFWTGWLYLPWILKMFWSPLVDARATKRRWLLGAQTVLSMLFLVIAAVIAVYAFSYAQQNGLQTLFTLTLFGFLLGAFASATLDIATDGYYLLALTPKDQSGFVGIRTIFYRLAMILGSGILVSATGALAEHGLVAPPYNWVCLFGFLGLLFLTFAFYHRCILPKPAADCPVSSSQTQAWKEAFSSYFTQQNILYILLFILLYRFGEALLEKIVPLFLLKPTAEGALGLSMQSYGLIKGTLGLGAIIAGNLAGGALLGKFGFKKCIWPFACFLVLPNFFYVYLAAAKPGLAVIAALITLENFGYGLAMMALTVFIMYVSQGAYKTSHYAISTGIMALGMMVPSMLSGKMQIALGYELFFWVTAFISLLSFAVVPLCFKIKSLEEAQQRFKQNKTE